MPWTAEEIAAHVAADIPDGWVVNLGVGLPTKVAGRLHGRPVMVHAENGILGVGPPPPPGAEDPDVIDPGKHPVTTIPGAAYMDSLTSFTLIRGGRLDLAVMGAYQVSERGDLANWRLPHRRGGAIGGAADLAVGAPNLWVMTTHRAKDGLPKLVQACTYPLTARSVVTRVYTDLAVLDVAGGELRPTRLAPGVTVEELRGATQARLRTAR